MDKQTAVSTVKAINRWNRRRTQGTYHAGEVTRGWDYNTWCLCYPQVSAVYSRAAEAITGRAGRYLPIA